MNTPSHQTKISKRAATVAAALTIAMMSIGCSAAPVGSVPPTSPAVPSVAAVTTGAPAPTTGAGSSVPVASDPAPTATARPSASKFVAHDFQVAPAIAPEPSLKLLWQTGDPRTPYAQLWVPTVDPTGRVWVASSLEGQFWIFSPSGRLLEKWGTPGKGAGQFDFLDHSSGGRQGFGGIAFGPDGSFWVADTGNVRIDKFDSNRKFVMSWGGFGTADGQFARPIAIGVDELGHIFVDDDARQDIQEFDANGTYIRTFAKGVAGPAMTVLDNGWVLTDMLPDGTPGHAQYHPDGTLGGTLDLSVLAGFPTGIATDNEGHIYLAAVTTGDAPSPQVLMEIGGDGISHVWPNGGDGIALDPKGTAIYETFSGWPYLRKYELPKP